jgi:hypothetical protein
MMNEQRMITSQRSRARPALRSGKGQGRRWFLETVVALAVGILAIKKAGIAY